ncbi:hypothetical protein ACWOFR_01325 [Carnobacterium gallinarum]|uniref:hypothetical protein n=1 Tax=Carnobacterium gallinarum TaxID=2749 RepID=UPI000555D466|nr:hypothetical protein [Carnobacterium gallinarum]
MLKFELLKIYREKTTYVLAAVLALVILVPLILGTPTIDYLQYYENNYQNNIRVIEKIKDDATAAETLNDIKESNSYLEKMIIATKNKNSDMFLSNELKYENKNLEDIKAGRLSSAPLIQQKATVAVLQYLYDNDIKKESYNVKELGSINYLSTLFSTPQIVLVVLILVSFQMIYIFNLDYKKNNFIIYSLSPRSYLNVFITKFSANIVAVLLNVGSVFLFVFSISWLKNGIGNWNYPIATIQNNNDVSIISTREFLLKIVIFIFIFLILLGLLSLLLSILSSNLILNIAVITLPLILGQYELLDTFISNDIKPFILLSYLDISNIIIGGSELKPITNAAFTYNNGLFLLSFSVVFLLILVILLLFKFPKKLIYKKFSQ